MINPRYVLPATIAASAHLALLLAFPTLRPPLGSPARPPAPPYTTWAEVPTNLFAPPEPPDPDPEPVRPVPGGGEPLPSAEDYIDHSTLAVFTVPVDLTPAAPRPVPTQKIAPGGPGRTGGPGEFIPGVRLPSPADLDSVPHARVQVRPAYPAAMRQEGAEGEAVVHFVVDATGRVVSADVLRATHPEFGEAAVRAVLHWRFEPGRRAGRAVPFQMSVPVQFRLDAS